MINKLEIKCPICIYELENKTLLSGEIISCEFYFNSYKNQYHTHGNSFTDFSIDFDGNRFNMKIKKYINIQFIFLWDILPYGDNLFYYINTDECTPIGRFPVEKQEDVDIINNKIYSVFKRAADLSIFY